MIRRAQVAEADDVTEGVRAAYKGYFPAPGCHPQPMDDNHGALIAADDVFIAVDDDKLGGVSDLQQNEIAELLMRTIAVTSGCQNEGVGTAPVAYAEQCADDRDITRLRRCTNEVMAGTARLYMRLGFVETHRSRPDGRQVIHMAKEVLPDRTPWFDVVVTDEDVCSGKPRIVGTGRYIDFLLARIERGQSFDDILVEFPHLDRRQLQAMVGFARDLVATKRNALKGELTHD